ncbi:DUF3575 domain-containing protein [Dysgonomonas sp. ZJ709]|uniref:DUF3575 domain-containing protein n=1 Tax=Dysgonomonas sp. ZJ709 TaxID=2709797 RepID=UPI0021049DD4|nr:DUF3575 domain-containing protein [Dysgonomonas sp. ZJ709]
MNYNTHKKEVLKILFLVLVILILPFGFISAQGNTIIQKKGIDTIRLNKSEISDETFNTSSDIIIPHDIPWQKRSMPTIAVKSNLLYNLTASFNLGVEFRLSDKYTLDISGSYNPWQLSRVKMFKHIMLQPELRYWINEPFNRHFLGFHTIYSHYNIGGFNIGSLKNNRYQGNLYGVGFSYGYNWYLAPRWSLEATLGFGYVYLDNVNQDCSTCSDGKGLRNNYQHYIGPTKAGISLIYYIK